MPGKGPGLGERGVPGPGVPCQDQGSKDSQSQLVPGPAILGSGCLGPSGYVPSILWLPDLTSGAECSGCLFLLSEQTEVGTGVMSLMTCSSLDSVVIGSCCLSGSVCVCVQCLKKAEEGRFLGPRVTDGCESPHGCLKLNPGPLEEQPMLLAT